MITYDFSGGLHTAAGAKHGAHHWYPDLEYHRQTYGGDGPVSKVRKLICSVAWRHLRGLYMNLANISDGFMVNNIMISRTFWFLMTSIKTCWREVIKSQLLRAIQVHRYR